MLSQRHKENLQIYSFNQSIKPENSEEGDKPKTQSMLYKAIEILKTEKQAIIKEKQSDLKQYNKQRAQFKMEIQYYKKKISEMSENTIIQTLLNGNEPFSQKNKKEEENFTCKKMQIEIDHLKGVLKEKEKIIYRLEQKNKELDQKIKLKTKEKEKNMEISLMEKISLEEKIELLEKDVAGKKRIIDGLKKEIENVGSLQKNLLRQQQNLVRRGKDMQKFEEEFQTYFNQNEKNLQNRIQVLSNENNFLKKQIRKVLKQVKQSCKCEGEAEEWKQKLFKIGKELAHARVELSKNKFLKERKENERSPKDLRDSSDSSLGSLVLSDDKSEQDY